MLQPRPRVTPPTQPDSRGWIADCTAVPTTCSLGLLIVEWWRKVELWVGMKCQEEGVWLADPMTKLFVAGRQSDALDVGLPVLCSLRPLHIIVRRREKEAG